jgi:hypothetical protein
MQRLHPAGSRAGNRNDVKEFNMSPRHIALLIALAGAALPGAFAASDESQKPAGPAVEKSMPAPQDCGRRMVRHDHGADKGTPTPMSVLCRTTPAPASGRPGPKADAGMMGHDHARFHKQM